MLENILISLYHKAQGRVPFGNVFFEKAQPCIEGRNGDKPFVAKFCDGTGPEIVFREDSQYEADRIGTGRDKDIREYGLRMSTGSAEDPLHGNRDLFPATVTDTDHGTPVGGDLLKLTPFAAARARASVQFNISYGLVIQK